MAGRTRTSNQTIISRYSERGLRARNLRRARCSNIIAPARVLPIPGRRGHVGEAKNAQARPAGGKKRQ
jgi:hypothetical protein